MYKLRLILFVLLLVLSNNLFSAVNFHKQTLLNYASFVASANRINIYVDVPLPQKIVFFVPSLSSPRSLLSAFRHSLYLKHLSLQFNSRYDYYYVVKDRRYKKSQHFIKLRYHDFKRIQRFLKSLKVSFVFYPLINSFSFFSSDVVALRVARFVNRVDVPLSEYLVRFVIFSFNNNLTKNKGFKFSSAYRSSSRVVRSVVNSLVLPLSSSSPFFSNVNFFSALHLLSSSQIVTVHQSPFFVSLSSKNFLYSSYLSVPFLHSTVTTSSNIASNNSSYQYKKVGLEIKGSFLPSYRSVVLNLHLKIASLIRNVTNVFLPSSSVRLLHSVVNIPLNKVLVISGLKKTSLTHKLLKVPFLSDIPYLGHLFTYRYSSNVVSNVSIAVVVTKFH